MKTNKCYAVPVILYVMERDKAAAEQLVKRRVAIEKEETIGHRWPDGPDFVGIIGSTDKVLRHWDMDEVANPEKFEKQFRKTWTPK